MITMTVDTRDLAKVNAAFRAAGVRLLAQIIPEELNRGGNRCYGLVRDNLIEETGLSVGEVTKALSVKPATRDLTYVITAQGGYTRVGFGARQVSAGVSHRAWGRAQVARGAFTHGGIAFVRTTAARYPIRPLFGPSIPRELERGKSQEIVNTVAAGYVVPNILSRCDAAIMSEGRARGLTVGGAARRSMFGVGSVGGRSGALRRGTRRR